MAAERLRVSSPQRPPPEDAAPELEPVPIGGITEDHAFRAMRAVPAGMSSNSLRRNTGIVIARPLRLAVFPLRILENSPIPNGFLPRKNKGRAKVYLYPSEDAQLLGSGEIELVLRLFFCVLP